MSPFAQNIGEAIAHTGAEVVPAWKQELNERLAATRSRRLRSIPEQTALPGVEELGQKAESRASRLAAKVAERYANAPSYSDVLAADVRARSHAAALRRDAGEPVLVAEPHTEEAVAFPAWHVSTQDESLPESTMASMGYEDPSPAVHEEVEEEEEMTVEPLAVNLIEFPRELVAARKVRPRLAEGPLRVSAEEAQNDGSQLKVFEVSSESVSQSVSVGPAPANWSPIRLDEAAMNSPQAARHGEPVQQKALNTATMEDRVMAAVFDGALIFAAFAVFVLVFVACTAHPPAGRPALMAGGLVLGGFALLYHYLFFRFAEATPGMRYARIALCTFEDENPSRSAMCRRVLLLLLSAAPLGLGFLWACFDQDRLGWHDRISRMYQRSYS